MQPTTSRLTALRIAAAIALLATLGTWAATGFHLGWTRTSAVTLQHDEITGIEYPVRHAAFVAGVEVLLLGMAATAAFGGLSWWAQRRQAARA